MAKWEQAIHYVNGEKRVLKVEDLREAAESAQDRARIRSLEIWDEGEEYRLFPRFRKGSPHFYCPSENVREIAFRSESSPAHNNRRKHILTKLKEHAWEVGFYFWDDKEKCFNPMFTTSSYSWDCEITRTLSSSLRWRHDIFGCKLDLRTSERFPWVAVEVIDSHYPTQSVFDAWLALSKMFPYIIAFDFVDKPNYFLKFHDVENWMRISCYIYDGALWDRDQRLETQNAREFEELFKRR